MRDFNTKRGSVIVEATAVFPLAIISVIVLIFMMSYFYCQLNERVDMHVLLRSESGRLCENMFYGIEVNEEITVYKKSQQIYSTSIVKSSYNRMLWKRSKKISARKYLIDECKFVRMSNAVEDGILTDE
jgi:hypothetical protein